MSRQQDGFSGNDLGFSLWICNICDKEYKSEAWYNKHLVAKHGVSRGGEATATAVSDFTQHSGQEQHHTSPCVPLIHTNFSQPCETENVARKPPLKIPFLLQKEWNYHNLQLETLLATKINKITEGNAIQEIGIFDDAVYSYFEGVFGSVKLNKKETLRESKSDSFKKKLRRRKRQLRKELKEAKKSQDVEKCHNLARAYRSLLKLVQEIRRKHEKNNGEFLKSKNEAEFDKDRYSYSKKKLQDAPGKIAFTKDQAAAYFKSICADQSRNKEYTLISGLSHTESEASEELAPPRMGDIVNILRKTRNKSAPGPNGISYSVYKNCPILQSYLLKFYSKFWKSQSCPPSFGQAIVKLLPKENVCDDPGKTRPIALTNTNGKVYFSIVANRVSNYMNENGLFNVNIQKGFVPGVAGCLEHTAVLTEALEDARRHERQLLVAWLDFGNAFGSVKHNLLQFSMSYYGVPAVLRNIIYKYYDSLHFSISTSEWSTDVIRFETGLFQGCCLSPVGFKIVFNLLLDLMKDFPQNSLYTFRKQQGLVVQPCLAFADDLTLLCRSKHAMMSLLTKVEDFCRWTGCMVIRASKCRALCLARRKSVFGPIDADLRIGGQLIEGISTATPFKFLGKFFEHKGKPDPAHAIANGFISDLEKVENLPLSGPRKAWIYNNLLVARINWVLLLYEIDKTTIKRLELKATLALKRWLGLRKSMDPSILYRSENNFGFGLKKLTTVQKQFSVTRSHILGSSRDTFVSELTASSRQDLGPLQREVEFDEQFMRGARSNREGLGWAKEKKKSAVEKMRASIGRQEESLAVVHAEGLQMQHDWLILGDICIPPKIMWNAFLYDWSPEMLKFYANAMQCTLPDPSNLKRWGLVDKSECPLCSRTPVGASHILAGCQTALKEGRFTWRHDKVLGIIREALSLAIALVKRQPAEQESRIKFVKSGEKVQKSKSSYQPSIVKKSDDWIILMDKGNRHYEFPPDIVITAKCPDITAISRKLKTIILIELTVPWDTNIPAQHEAKLNRYSGLCAEIRQKGFRCYCHAVEVGARGLPAKSVYGLFKELGLSRKLTNSFLQRVSKTALEASYRLWLRRSEQWMPGEGRVAAAQSALTLQAMVSSPGPGK